MLYLFKRSFKRFEGFDIEQEVVGEGEMGEQEEGSLNVTLELPDSAMVMPADGSENERFTPKEKSDEEKAKEEYEQEKVGGQDETGAIRAFHTWNNSNIEQTLSDQRQLLPREEDKVEYKEYALYNIDLWLLSYEKELAQEKGQEAAFTSTITPRPQGAKLQGPAAEFEAPDGVEEPTEDLGIPTFQ